MRNRMQHPKVKNNEYYFIPLGQDIFLRTRKPSVYMIPLPETKFLVNLEVPQSVVQFDYYVSRQHTRRQKMLKQRQQILPEFNLLLIFLIYILIVTVVPKYLNFATFS
jgi:hypothetical protein